MIDLIAVLADGWLTWGDRRVRAALGRGGVTETKREGDGCTPAGTFALRGLLYRPDRLARPPTMLACAEIAQDSGWSDDPSDPNYNRAVKLPHGFGHERLWREDGVYDLIVPLGYNDAPPIAGRGSAIFLHVARPAYTPTEGCVALALNDLLRLLAKCGPETRLEISCGRS
jgi:L,D-peptidoglycan transpeptidase YkuD (ErfK/YbiS/YcfS/YnhG family)